MSVYNITGKLIGDVQNFTNNMYLDYRRDESTNTNYTIIRIFKVKIDGAKQYPFIYAPNGAGAGTQSTLSMNAAKGFYIAINAGVFNTNDKKPIGTVIQNGILVHQNPGSETASDHYLLTIDSNGNLGYAERNADGSTLISQGIVSAIDGFAPCVINYADALNVLPNAYNDMTSCQRQIIGQFGNGDYAILTCEGRNYDNSTGWTIPQAKAICYGLGLKYAYDLDGGGSVETVLGKKQINAIYDGTYGRIVPTYIVFNGTSTFGEPT